MSLRKLLPALMCISFAGAALADNTAAPQASGIDGSAMDRSVRPQDDLFRFVNGTWLANTPFPAEYASAGIGIMLFEKAQADVQAILLEAAAAGDKATPEMQRLGAMYGSFMDEKKVEERGIEPLKPLFAEIAEIDGPKALAQYFGRAAGRGISVPLGVYVYPDARNSTHNIAYLDQDGLGMPNRDYFLKTEAEYVEFRRKYVEYLAKLLTLAGETGGSERAAKILELETKLATDQWTPVDNRDPIKTYNKNSLESAAKLSPGFDWNTYHAASGLPAGDFVIRQPSYVTALGKHMNDADLAVWKDYLTVRTIGAYARAAAGRLRRGLVRFQLAHAARHRVAPPTLEARSPGDRQRHGRGDRRGLCRAPLPAGSQGADGDARRQPARGIRPRDRPARVDERDDQDRSALEAQENQREDRLPGQVARLHRTRDPRRTTSSATSCARTSSNGTGRPRAPASRRTRASGS